MAGFRKPSLKKSLSARTTGKYKRAVKRAANPLYGKKGMGFVKDPKRSINNAVYHRTTIGGISGVTKTSHSSNSKNNHSSTPTYNKSGNNSHNGIAAILAFLGIAVVCFDTMGWFFGGIVGGFVGGFIGLLIWTR